MDDIKTFEKRILAAFDRVARGIEARGIEARGIAARGTEARAPDGGATPADAAAAPDTSGLHAQLGEAQAEVARLRDRLRQVPPRDPSTHEARIDKLTRQLDVQGIEMQRLRKANISLREELRVLREAAEGAVDPGQINRAMKDELEALRATRHAEIAEMDEILGELTAMIGEVRHA